MPLANDAIKDVARMKYWTLSDDPHAEREAHKYGNPAPSREYLLAALEAYGKPITHENMSRMLGLEDERAHQGCQAPFGGDGARWASVA